MTIFTKIINKEIPATILYEDQDVLAFLDISQVTKGHTLVIPKQPSRNLLDTNPNTLSKVMDVVSKLANQIQSTLQPNGFNILSNVNEVAGQSVFHFHVHIIPRYDEDDQFKITQKATLNPDLEAIKNTILSQ